MKNEAKRLAKSLHFYEYFDNLRDLGYGEISITRLDTIC